MEFQSFSCVIGYTFQSDKLRQEALTHSSASSQEICSFERLEFIGDRVLALVISHLLYQYYKDQNEGFLARKLSSLCSKRQLVKIGGMWAITKYLATCGLQPEATNVIADAVEAVLGAVYLDGGFQAASSLIERHWMDDLLHEEEEIDFKSQLQMLLQGKKYPPPTYIVLDKEGPDHSPIFIVQVTGAYQEATGQSTTRKLAEQAAAKILLDKIDVSRL